jgi:predicted nuclease of predicted toxin-antitoxin system
MKLVADEGVDAPIVNLLRSGGHEVFYILEEYPGLNDEGVLKIANDRKEILIVQDKDFGELIFRLKQIHSGVILVRFSGVKPLEKAKIILAAIEEHGAELAGAFTVINKNHIKIRKQEII